MAFSIFQLVLSLLIIVVAAEIFTNALEHLGQKLKISEGVTGSLFAAVGTALPETIVPIIAIASGTAVSVHNEEIGVGAILGAPLMLSTLSVFIMALAVVGSRGLNGHIRPEPRGFRRDTRFFLLAFIIAATTMFVPHSNTMLRATISGSLIGLYVIYVILTVHASKQLVQTGEMTEAGSPLLLNRIGLPVSLLIIVLQVLIGTGILVGGAFWFIDGVQDASGLLGISALLLSLIIIPIATELPEKINSVLWIRKNKDTLALGNITGAMVFQGTILPSLGIMLTPWEPRSEVLLGVIITLIAAFWLWLNATRKQLKIWALGVNGLLYIIYIAISLFFQKQV